MACVRVCRKLKDQERQGQLIKERIEGARSELKEQERQGQLIKERIEERKKRKQQETSLSDGRRQGAVVVVVGESNDTFNSLDE